MRKTVSFQLGTPIYSLLLQCGLCCQPCCLLSIVTTTTAGAAAAKTGGGCARMSSSDRTARRGSALSAPFAERYKQLCQGDSDEADSGRDSDTAASNSDSDMLEASAEPGPGGPVRAGCCDPPEGFTSVLLPCPNKPKVLPSCAAPAAAAAGSPAGAGPGGGPPTQSPAAGAARSKKKTVTEKKRKPVLSGIERGWYFAPIDMVPTIACNHAIMQLCHALAHACYYVTVVLPLDSG
jgi:hypothetical protein